MSKRLAAISAPITALLFLLCASVSLSAQVLTVTIKLDADDPTKAFVSGKRLDRRTGRNSRHLAFRTEAPAVSDLAARVSDVEAFADAGKPLELKKLMAGEYLADNDIVAWQYRIDLTPPRSSAASAHVSWIANDRGFLMLDDLVPITAADSGDIVWVFPELPAGWTTFTSGASSVRSEVLATTDHRNLVIAVGKNWRNQSIRRGGTELSLALNGEWLFTDAEAAQMVAEVVDAYSKRFGPLPLGGAGVLISKFPKTERHGNWQAETRGNSVTVISSDMPFKTQSLQRLHEQLRHELFHLWIPNGVNLTGKYDWFYEGFALYQSLRLAVELNRIRFEDMLDTLSRAHTIDSFQSQRISLLQASANRFAGANTQVYARGMLVGFLCDLALLERSKGKRSIEDLLREIVAKHRKPAAAVDGNTAVVGALKSHEGLGPIVDKYVTGTEKIEWAPDLAAAGIEDMDPGPITTLRVKEKVGGRQKTLLGYLGYNNWRKLSR